MQELEQEIKELIVKALALEDVKSEDIVSSDPLFGEGLGLDSIDALELAMALSKAYGVKFSPEDEGVPAIFASVQSLAAYISEHRQAIG
jgi:acyl carrier protein